MPAPERNGPRVPLLASRDDGLPWVRLVTGLVGVVMLAIPVGRQAVESGTPIPAHVVVAQALPRAEPLPRPVLRSPDAEDAALEAAPSDASPNQSPRQARAFAASVPRDPALRVALRRARCGAAGEHRPHAYLHASQRRRVLTRAQVEREYLASREQVAALTGEDSGSVWLARVAARRRTMRW